MGADAQQEENYFLSVFGLFLVLREPTCVFQIGDVFAQILCFVGL